MEDSIAIKYFFHLNKIILLIDGGENTHLGEGCFFIFR